MAELSLQEMLQVMDVAREMRADRELVSRELSREETIARLRERMLASTKLTGESLQPAEIDAAIELYLNNQHIYRDPPWSLSVLLAHLYVRRIGLMGILFVACTVGLLIWAWTPSRRFPDVQPIEVTLTQLQSSATTVQDREQIAQLARQLDRAVSVENRDQAEAVRVATQQLIETLGTEFQIRIVQEGRSAVRRDFSDETGVRSARYYVIVEAISASGPVSQTIESAETGARKVVTQWGEEVPASVYERLKADKLEDGILDERNFATKERGQLNWNIQLPDQQGNPLVRKSQILEW